MTEAPALGSRWVSPTTAAYRFSVIVVAVFKDFVVAREDGADMQPPFVVHANEWHKRFEPAPPVRKDEPHTDA